jgi:hypothetical protein
LLYPANAIGSRTPTPRSAKFVAVKGEERSSLNMPTVLGYGGQTKTKVGSPACLMLRPALWVMIAIVHNLVVLKKIKM